MAEHVYENGHRAGRRGRRARADHGAHLHHAGTQTPGVRQISTRLLVGESRRHGLWRGAV